MTAALALMHAGYEVFWPAQDGSPTDLVISRPPDTGFLRCQVKTAHVEEGSIRCNTRCDKYKPGDFSYLVVVYGQRVWTIPARYIWGCPTLTLSSFATRELLWK